MSDSQICESVGGFDKSRRIDPLGLAADLRKVSIRNSIGAHQQYAADDSFPSDRADFDAAAIFHDRDDGHHPAFGKIGMANRLIRLIGYLWHFELNRMQAAVQEVELFCGEL